ncbi:MAG: TonB-dependent receptor [Xanthomonadales bacterium]|nr:TonB-dependent receptor [Xanthomonadales bacterium]
MKKRALISPLIAAATAVPASIALMTPGAAFAALEEIVVTVRQRAETLQDVPASVTAFTSSELERIGVQRAEDFISLTPGVVMVNTVEVGDTQVNIRGLNGARDGETNFAFILDGILYTNPSAFNREYADLAQVEVLKGPQGALYGRSAAAGAVIVTTQKPRAETEGHVELSAGQHGSITAQGTVAGQLGEGLYGRLSADYRDTDGFLSNNFLDDDVVNDFQSNSLQGRLIWEPNDRTTIDAKLRYAEVDAAAIAFNASFALPLFADLFGVPDFYENANDHNFVFSPNVDPANEQETTEFSVKLDYEMDWATLTSWMLYSDQEQFFVADGTSGAFGFYFGDPACQSSAASLAGFPIQSPTFISGDPLTSLLGPYTPTTCDGYQYQERNQEDLSFQLQLTSNSDGPLRWQTGIYLLDIDRRVGVAQLLDDGRANLPRSFVNELTDALVLDDFETQVSAIFGSVFYDVTDNVELALSLRYDREEREVSNAVPTPSQRVSDRINYCANIGPGFCSFDGVTPLAGTPLNPAFIADFSTGLVVDSIADRKETFSELQPKLSATWDVSDNLTVFGSWGVGFKSGGFNNIGATETIQFFLVDGGAAFGTELTAPPEIFQEETSSAFELGFKYKSENGRLDLDGAIFNTEVDDMQFFEFFVGPFGLLRVVENIDEVSLQGVELAAAAELNDNFSITAGFSIIDSEIEENAIRPNTVGNEAPSVPEYTFNIAAQYIRPAFDNTDLVVRVEYFQVGDTWFHTVQDNVVPATLFGGVPANFDRSQVEAYGITNLRVGLENQTWSAVAYARNLFDEKYLAEVITAPEFGGSFVHPGMERTAGLEFSYRF